MHRSNNIKVLFHQDQPRVVYIPIGTWRSWMSVYHTPYSEVDHPILIPSSEHSNGQKKKEKVQLIMTMNEKG
jgi:hypothetical protein